MRNRINILSISVILLTVLGIFFTACTKDDPVPEIVATSIELVSGDNQTAQIETALTNSLVVLIKDQDGNAFKGATVAFAVSEGSVSVATATTDAEGKATVNWTLGATVGAQILTVTAFKADGITALTGSPISVTATGTELPAATSIELVSANNLKGDLGTSLADVIEVLVKDQNGNAFVGATVSFTVTEGSVTNSNLTDANGKTNVTWTLGATTVGTQTLTVTSSFTSSPITVNATTILTDIEGNEYNIIKIGTQIWMTENIKVTHYDNSGTLGAAIPNDPGNGAGVFTASEWVALSSDATSKAYCYYNDNANNEKDTYGALYTYAAATNGDTDGTTQGLCPTGWHLPNNTEWTTLTDFLGGSNVAGSKLAGNASLWTTGTLTNDANFGVSGFSALPSGIRDQNGVFVAVGDYTYWRTATQGGSANTAYFRDITYQSIILDSWYTDNWRGFSVRCVKD